jgi:uncharacterized protein
LLHRLQTSDHGFDAGAHLLVLLQQAGPFGAQGVLALAKRPVLLLEMTDRRDEIVEPLLEAFEFQFDRGLGLGFTHNTANIEPLNRQCKASSRVRLRYHSITMMSEILFSDFEDVLAAAGSHADAAEAHGCLCGALCSMSVYRMQDWINEVLPDASALSPESAAVLEKVFEATTSSFGEQGMEFEPLLPDDGESLNGRANALGLWCTGFLYGLGAGKLSDLTGLQGDVGEIVRDFSEISRATGEGSESDESNEQAYTELVEFIRVGAQVVYEELLPLRQHAFPDQPRLH